MLKVYLKTSDLLARLRSDKAGVVSLEYIIVAVAIIAVVGTAFGSTGPLADALKNGLTAIGTKLSSFTG